MKGVIYIDSRIISSGYKPAVWHKCSEALHSSKKIALHFYTILYFDNVVCLSYSADA